MADLKPVVLKNGELQALQSGDSLVDPGGIRYGTGSVPIAVSGTQDGSNKVFTLAQAVTGTELTFLNGQLLLPGSSNDYIISGTTLTFQAARPAPESDDVIQVFGYTGSPGGATMDTVSDDVRARLNLAILQ